MIGLAIAAFTLAQLADVFTTERALANGAQEENPAVRWMMDNFGRGWIIIKLALACIILSICLQFDLVSGIWAGAAVTAFIAWRNTRYM